MELYVINAISPNVCRCVGEEAVYNIQILF